MPFVAGQYHQICDVCGFKFLSNETKIRWDGLLVCPADYEIDHPQKFIRVQPDGQSVPNVRPEPEDRFLFVCTPFTRAPVADLGTADCATVGAPTSLPGYPPFALPPAPAPSPPPVEPTDYTLEYKVAATDMSDVYELGGPGGPQVRSLDISVSYKDMVTGVWTSYIPVYSGVVLNSMAVNPGMAVSLILKPETQTIQSFLPDTRTDWPTLPLAAVPNTIGSRTYSNRYFSDFTTLTTGRFTRYSIVDANVDGRPSSVTNEQTLFAYYRYL
jgi:hypothetical protein